MTGPDFSVDRRAAPPSRKQLYDAQSVLIVTRPPQAPVKPAAGQPGSRSSFVPTEADMFLAVRDDGSVVAFNGHVDLGTGIGTALAQIVAEELDVPLTRVSIVLGHTTETPNQGPTIASATLQITAVPLRHAAAQARQWLVAQAATRLAVGVEELDVRDGTVYQRGAAAATKPIGYGELIAGQRVELQLTTDAPLKSPDAYKVVGKRAARVDIPAKATGELSFVHDVRVPGMLHGRVVRPPYGGVAQGDFVGNSLLRVDEASIRDLPGIVKVVVIRDFVGVVAEREEIAQQAAKRLDVQWKNATPLPPLETSEEVEAALRANPAKRRDLVIEGDVDAALSDDAARTLNRTYVWPFQMHASIGPSCAVADYREGEGALKVWSGTQNPHSLRADLALLLTMDEAQIEIVRMDAAGCYGRNCADDVAADAALLSRATGAPVRVQLSREDEHAWEPKGAAQLMDVRGALSAEGELAAYDFATRYPSNDAPTLALLLTGTLSPQPQVFEMGDRTAVPPYDYRAMRIVCDDTPPIVRASWLRGVSALPNTFAHESFIDELAAEAGDDPLEFRLKHVRDPRAADLLKAVAERAGWQPRQPASSAHRDDGDIARGRGIAYARYVHSKFPGFGAAWCAWVADVEVNRRSGELAVTRVVVGQDNGTTINPDGVRHQIHGNVIQAASRALKERVTFGDNAVTSQEWGAYPILTFREVPVIDVVMMPRHGEPPMGAGESASLPGAAAIANALYDATGVRFRRPPFTPETIRAALADAQAEEAAARRKKRWRLGFLGAFAAGAAGWLGALSLAPSALAPMAPPLASAFAPELVARGKVLASLGNCAVCHTAHNGVPNAGGKPLDTPFGTVYSTNITPDAQTGIGAWSLAAFVRAMREGISRDGHRLYPAFPYTSFKNTSDDDLEALYAYLMSQTPVRFRPPETKLPFPFGARPLMAAWNGLFLARNTFAASPTQNAQWNRGAYLVNGLGHCSACHTPRNAFGAEKTGAAFMGGGSAEGWEAPALSSLSNSPVPWTEDELFSYLRFGHAPLHGVAAGPMAPVVADLAALPDSDIRAMATYLASLSPVEPNVDATAMARQYEKASAIEGTLSGVGARLFDGACAACHHTGSGPQLFGAHPSLALNTNLHSATPDNLIRVILDGIGSPARPELGTMPAYRDSFNDAQIAELVSYLRRQFAGGKPAWPDVAASVARIRAAPRAE
ncbi:molybdopterin cofactor-binding domain-containing protein [Paraburkholderia phenoliruptrix]|uniref:Molybdopterin cofactor-binding domain-containing protein n=1 Tax=Paraburkholderia phenoliruptrix TaxID=252970 RepID=A0ABV3W7J4_9BURK|nr:molybdopterin cofactor-binding domain-containing protein [Paraburkholderia phenoliruptrix]MDR6390820.1 nicotinate dehydrogenase subunit B [Paraburkholderia phenoliruptrix]